METKVLQVFYGKDCLPYKDKERAVHFPIVGAAIQGASNTTKIRFYFDQLVEEDDETTSWVVVSKLPNGKIGSEIVETALDEELNEHYALFTLKNFYTQAKGDLFLSLQGYQGGVQVETDPDTGISQIVGTPTIQATGSIKLAINYATQLVGSGETANINFQKILADLGTKLGIRAYTERVTELPTTGETNVFYAIYDDPNNPNKLNIYVWNKTTKSYVWVGDNSIYLGNYMTQEQGQELEEELEQTNNRIDRLTVAYNYKGSKTVAEINALTGMSAGDVYNITDSGTITTGSVSVIAGDNIAWTGSVWDKLAGSVDLSGYLTKIQSDEKYTEYHLEDRYCNFLIGNIGAENEQTNRISLAETINIYKGETLEAQAGYEFTIYEDIAVQLSGAWVSSYTPTQDYQGCYITFRKTDNTDFTNTNLNIQTIMKPSRSLYLNVINDGFKKDIVKYKEIGEKYFVLKLVQGNRRLKNNDANRISLSTNFNIKSGDTFCCKYGWQCAIWQFPSYVLITGAWVGSFVFTQDYSNCIIVFRKSDDSNINAQDYSIEDIVKTFVINEIDTLNYQFEVKDILIKKENVYSKWYLKTATFMGDSITAGLTATQGKLYWNVLQQKLGFKKVDGMGVAGSCISITSDYGSQYSPISTRWNTIPDSDLIVIFAGTNDYGHDTPIGSISDATDISFYGALNVIISGLMNLYPTRRIAFMTPLHRLLNTTYPDTTPNGQGKTLKDYVDAIKNVCEKYGIPVIDAFSFVGINPVIPNMQDDYFNDNVHINDSGHSLLADRIISKIEEL